MPKTAKAPDATSLLEADHAKVRKLLEQLEKARDAGRRRELLERIDEELTVHATIEEEVFYPAFREAGEKKEDDKLFFEAIAEHHVVKVVLPDLRATPPDSEEFAGRAKVLKELVEHHAEEEEKEMFPRARRLLGKERLRDLGAQLAARKGQLRG